MRIALFLTVCGVGDLHPVFGEKSSLDGIWRSQGYAYIFEIKGKALKAYEVTTTTCVVGFTAQLQTSVAAGREVTFKSKDEGVSFVRTGGNHDHKAMHQEGAVPDIRIDRIESLPPVCRHPTADTPLNNFEVFSRTWAEQYISFERRHADWERIVSESRPKLNSATTPQQLFDIFEGMIRPLGDLHTSIQAPALKKSTKVFWRAGTDRIIRGSIDNFEHRGRWELFSMIDHKYLQTPAKMFCKRHLQYGYLDETTGYLRILSFGGYATRDDLSALEKAMDAIFSDQKLQTLVIDMRLSLGGSDELGLAIASRLATAEYLAYTVEARSDPVDRNRWTDGMPIVVRPSSRPGFRGLVAILTGPITMSAAETFIQALMGRPGVTRIGESTQGVFCDSLDRHLPNGWTFSLPNAIYLTGDGRAFDVTGIPADLEAPVFADADVVAGKDPALEMAREKLRSAARSGGSRD